MISSLMCYIVSNKFVFITILLPQRIFYDNSIQFNRSSKTINDETFSQRGWLNSRLNEL
jgi:hypothetical protein